MPNFNALMPGPSFDIGNSIKNANSLAGMIDARKERERVAGAENALRQYVEAADEPTRKNALMELSRFDPEATMKVRDVEQQKARERVTDGLQLLSGVSDQASWDSAIRTYTYLHPDADTSHLPPQYSPEIVGQLRQQLDGIVGTRGASSMARPVMIPDAIGPDGQAGTEIRYADGTQEFIPTNKRRAEKVGPVPAGYRLVGDRLERIPGADEALAGAGGSAGPRPGVEMLNAKALFERGQAALREFDPYKDLIPSFIEEQGGKLPSLGNVLKNPEYQAQTNAARNFIAAVLRKESGGAITTDEWADYYPMYFPMAGDQPLVLEQKARLRSAALDQLGTASGSALPGSVVTQQPAEQPQSRPPLKFLIQRR